MLPIVMVVGVTPTSDAVFAAPPSPDPPPPPPGPPSPPPPPDADGPPLTSGPAVADAPGNGVAEPEAAVPGATPSCCCARAKSESGNRVPQAAASRQPAA